LNNKLYPWQKQAWAQLLGMRAKLPQALLVHGPQGIGKLALADHFAQLLLCEAEGVLQAPCGTCAGCRWFLAGTHPDLRRLEPESLERLRFSREEQEEAAPAGSRTQKPSTEIRIGQVRSLDGFLNLRSHRGRQRVVLVHPAEDTNVNAANALLKGLEEPQAQAHFILVSNRPARLLPTIRSRCVALPIPLPDRAAAGSWLKAQGLPDWEAWLAFAGGAPLRALEYASSAGESISRLRKAVQAKDLETLGAINDREQIEALAEVLQKHALNVAMQSCCGQSRYGPAVGSAQAAAWLRYARQMGRNRLLASHPLNPRLFAAEMIAAMPKN
jgi:DNA polymerase-3 subunit delta'